MEELKLGVIKYRIIRDENGYGRRHDIGICKCGQHVIQKDPQLDRFQCNKCGNDYFVDAYKEIGRFSIPHLKVLHKDNTGFKVTRTNLSVRYTTDKGLEIVRKNLSRTIEYNIATKTLRVWREEEIEYDYQKYNNSRRLDFTNQYFFTNLDIDSFIDAVSTDVTRDVYRVAKRLGNKGYNRKISLLLGFTKLMDKYSYLQILANAGIPDIERFYRGNNYWRREDTVIDKTKTKPHQILQVPKFMIKYIREDLTIDYNVLESLQGYLKSIDNNKLKEIMSIVNDEGSIKDLSNCVDTIMQLHNDYDYKNLKHLAVYLFRVVRLTQGINTARAASTLLRDYIRMARVTGHEYFKYPKSLKKEHDIVQMNFNALHKDDAKKEEFKLAVNADSYQSLQFDDKDSKLAIIIPSAADDLVREGSELSHCVASYINDVANDKCKILLLRDMDDIEKPLATIEVRGLNIRQAKSFSNSRLNDEQREFVSKWAEEKGLMEAYY